MELIPVLDLKGGRAVHARRGQRASFAPVTGIYGSGDDAAALARALSDALGVRRLYVADLDALAGAPAPDPAVGALAALGLELWVDAGVASADAAESLITFGAARAIVALETLPALEQLREIALRFDADHLAFSLDLRGGHPVAANPALATLDPGALAREAVLAGFDTILVIDLARVGSDGGPDDALLRRVRAAVPDARLIAGGGVRGVADMERLAALGCDGALVATALHDGRIRRADVERLALQSARAT